MITSSSRMLACLSLLGSMALAAMQWDGGWVACLNEFGNLPQRLEKIQREAHRHEILLAGTEATRARMQAKQRIARALLADQVTLDVAAVQYREVASEAPYKWDHYRHTQPLWSERRRLFQYVIDLTREVLICDGHDPSAKVSELTKLANECQ